MPSEAADFDSLESLVSIYCSVSHVFLPAHWDRVVSMATDLAGTPANVPAAGMMFSPISGLWGYEWNYRHETASVVLCVIEANVPWNQGMRQAINVRHGRGRHYNLIPKF